MVNQTFRSGPTAILIGEALGVGMGNSVITPSRVIRPTRLPSTARPSMRPLSSRNHILPSAPAVISPGPRLGPVSGNSVMTPFGVMRTILPALNAQDQTLPSGPVASARGPLSGVGIRNSVITPLVLTRPIFPPLNSPNQIAP